jgi:hypothetical protein
VKKTDQPFNAPEAVARQLQRDSCLVSLASFVAAVLEDEPHLTISQIYAAVWGEVRAGRAEVREDTRTGIVSVQRRTPVAGEDLAAWTLANDVQLMRLVDRLEEFLDEALVAAGAGKIAVRVIARFHDQLVMQLCDGLAVERGRAVEAFVRESGAHPSDVRRRVELKGLAADRDARGGPMRTNPAPPRRFDS